MKPVRIIICLTFTLISYQSFSQGGPWKKRRQIEYSGFFDSYFWRGPFNYYGSLGTSAYFGDLSSTLENNTFKPSLGIGANYNMWARILLGAEFQYFGLGATDEIQERNLKFSSTNYEFTAYGRFEILYDRILKHTERSKKPKLIKPYMHLGMSMLHYKASAIPNGPGTGDSSAVEGISYPKWTFVIPTGLGVKFSFSHRMALSAQVSYRISFTDYLDQVSELRGSPEKKDSYASFNVMFEFTPGARPNKKRPKRAHETESNSPSSTGSNSDNTKTSTPTTDSIETPNNSDENLLKDDEVPDETIPDDEIEENENLNDEDLDPIDDQNNSDDEWDDSEWSDENDNGDDQNDDSGW